MTAATAERETILVVDDDEFMRSASARVLAKLGYQVRVASDGVEARDILEAHGDQIRLVISDAVMPRLDGPALFHLLRDTGNRVPFLLVSGRAERELAAVGADPTLRFLSKPWGVQELAGAVRAALAAEPVATEST